MKRLGIDIGSLYLKAALIEDNSNASSADEKSLREQSAANAVIATRYIEHKGNVRDVLTTVLAEKEFAHYDTAGITGNIALLGDETLDNTLSLIEGVRFLLPESRNVFAIGGETFSLILFDEKGDYIEHSLNPPCASGTGSFIEQQAERLSITAGELAQKASDFSGKSPSIATRCAVFAKTDIIHAMQEGYSLEAVCAGLSEGIARSILDFLVKGRELFGPVAVVGGVSRNKKITDTIGRITGKKVVVPTASHVTGAIGAALLGSRSSIDVDELFAEGEKGRSKRDKLRLALSDYPDFSDFTIEETPEMEVLLPKQPPAGVKKAVMGIDIGSTSTKAVILTEEKELMGGFYTRTRGNPIDAVRSLLREAENHLGSDIGTKVIGVVTTGSGRKMIRELFQADFHVNEITAHAKAAVELHPKADTIVEIGGQDSKFTRVRGGDVYYSTMNYVCAAGTGSFIEEQAKRLGLSLEEFASAAMQQEAPYTSDRCTVYMERDLSELMSEGWSVASLAGAVLNSVRDNYIAKVVNKSPLGDYIVFQGATARNRALVAAFENLLEKPIHVSPLCHLTGALGSALLWFEERALTAPETAEHSSFRWNFDAFTMHEEICDRCSNRCLLTIVEKDGRYVGWGMKCGKEYEERAPKKSEPSGPEKRFAEIMAPLFHRQDNDGAIDGNLQSVTVALPHVLYNVEYAPLWTRFLNNMGLNVIHSHPSTKAMAKGKKIVNSDFCAPMILSHGYIADLEETEADFLFVPAMVNEENPDQDSPLFKKKVTERYFCYYSQYLPSLMSKLTSIDLESKMITPILSLNSDSMEQITENLYNAFSSKIPAITREAISNSFSEAYETFRNRQKEWKHSLGSVREGVRNGYPAADSDTDSTKEMNIVIIGRPYVMFDSILNLEIPKKMEDYGTNLSWMDELDLEAYQPSYGSQYLERMHWHYGRQIIKTAEYAASQENLFVVFLTCFRCSPDSFLLSYVKDIMLHYDKPFLVLQLDEHSSAVGYETRIEAGLHAFRNYLQRARSHRNTASPPGTLTDAKNDLLTAGDTVLVPYLDHLISKLWSDCFIRAGFDALLLHDTEKSLNTGYRYANGGECMPLVALIGSVIETVKTEQLEPEKTFFYIPTVCMACNMPQFPILAQLAFRNAGLGGIKVGLINSMAPGEIIGPALSMKMLEANIIGSLMYKMYFRIKPYEKEAGITDRVLSETKRTMGTVIREGGALRNEFQNSVDRFSSIDRDESRGRKPRIAIIGDLYVKYNELINQNLQKIVDELGGELLIPSLTEYPFHFYDADIRLFGDNPRPFRLLKTVEGRYEKIAEKLIGDNAEPDFESCYRLMEEYNVRHYITGETSINIGRALYYLSNHLVDAVLHVNPMFCCPGVVTASFYRKMQQDFGIPIIDLFYDGTGNPNRVLIPHLHYLQTKERG